MKVPVTAMDFAERETFGPGGFVTAAIAQTRWQQEMNARWSARERNQPKTGLEGEM